MTKIKYICSLCGKVQDEESISLVMSDRRLGGVVGMCEECGQPFESADKMLFDMNLPECVLLPAREAIQKALLDSFENPHERPKYFTSKPESAQEKLNDAPLPWYLNLFNPDLIKWAQEQLETRNEVDKR